MKKLNKKSQLTIYIILGIILVIGAILAFYFIAIKKEAPTKPELEKLISLDPKPINQYVKACISHVSRPLIDRIARQGGTFELNNYRIYEKIKYNYFCIQDGVTGCANQMITKESMQNELSDAVVKGLLMCIDLDAFKKQGFSIETKAPSVKISINPENIFIELKYPLALARGGSSLTISDFSETISSDLGKTYDLAAKIAYEETTKEFFDQNDWMTKHGGEIEIEQHKPYPDIVYNLIKYNPATKEKLRFAFAINSLLKVNLIGYPEPPKNLKGFCKTKDKNCYSNVDEAKCKESKGTWSSAKPDDSECTSLSSYSSQICFGGKCLDCAGKKHSESWCVYDGITSPGFAEVGSRHFLQSCMNGKIFTTECADYREELCTQNSTFGITKAACRVNRWHDCSQQTTAGDCLNLSIRDCYWADWLFKSYPWKCLYNNFQDRKCLPYVPPGFVHWQGSSQEVCAMANEQFDCDEDSCPQMWSDSAAAYCMFQGDCGAKYNFAGAYTKGGYSNTDKDGFRDYVKDYSTNAGDYFVLTLPLNTTTRINLTGHEFYYPAGTEQEIRKTQQRWVRSCSKPKITDELIYYNVMQTSRCYPWAVPKSGDCSKCSESDIRPCSEYRCRSISKNCRFRYDEFGIAQCYEVAPETIKPKLEIKRIALLKNETIISDIVKKEGIDWRAFESNYAYDLKPEEDNDFGIKGYEVKDKINPYSMAAVTIDSSKPVKCKTSFSPAQNYDSLPRGVEYLFNRTIVLLKFPSPQNMKKKIKAEYGLLTPLQIFSNKTYEQQIDQILDEYRDLGFEINESMLEQAKNLTMGVMSSLEPIMSVIKENYQKIMIELESGKVSSFILCRDEFDNEFKTYVKFNVENDNSPPKLIKQEPKNNEIIPGNSLNIDLWLDEPAECRWHNEKDFDFNSPLGIMSCATDDIEADENGLFECLASIPASEPKIDIYVKCKDLPSEEKRYAIRFNPAQELNLSGSSMPEFIKLMPPNNINVMSQAIERENMFQTIIDYNQDIARNAGMMLNISFQQKGIKCRHDIIDRLYYDMYQQGQEMDCILTESNTTRCTKRVFPTGTKSYYFNCIIEEIPGRNMAEFELSYKK